MTGILFAFLFLTLFLLSLNVNEIKERENGTSGKGTHARVKRTRL